MKKENGMKNLMLILVIFGCTIVCWAGEDEGEEKEYNLDVVEEASEEIDEESRAIDKANEERIAKYDKYTQSAEYNFDQACNAQKSIKHFKKQKDYQNQIASETGVVDKVALYQAGKGIIDTKNYLEVQKQEYKKRAGKDLDLGKCK